MKTLEQIREEAKKISPERLKELEVMGKAIREKYTGKKNNRKKEKPYTMELPKLPQTPTVEVKKPIRQEIDKSVWEKINNSMEKYAPKVEIQKPKRQEIDNSVWERINNSMKTQKQ